jgi:hypothetical protein
MFNDDDDETENDDNFSDMPEIDASDIPDYEEPTEDAPISPFDLKNLLVAGLDPVKAMAHRFEYHIFHAGDVHRVGRAAHEDAYPLVGEWIRTRLKGDAGGEMAKKPFHVFLDGKLWSVLTFKEMDGDKACFEEVSTMFGLVEDSEKEDDLRVFDWRM